MIDIEKRLALQEKYKEYREKIKEFVSELRTKTRLNMLMICLLIPFDIRNEFPSARAIYWATGLSPTRVYQYQKLFLKLQSELWEVDTTTES